ncbi:hypothetical protein T439DRAFT_320089 [Meredithblackwellia eburnea MCA 4105]
MVVPKRRDAGSRDFFGTGGVPPEERRFLEKAPTSSGQATPTKSSSSRLPLILSAAALVLTIVSSLNHNPGLWGPPLEPLAERSPSQFITPSTPTPFAPSSSIPSSTGSHRTLVGERRFPPQYYGRGCDSRQLLQAIKGTRVKPGGLAHEMPANRSFALQDFDFSFEWPKSCPRPHVFNPDEACDLVSAFGGIVLQGDSLTRHLTNALFILLRNRADGAIHHPASHGICRGDSMFQDGTGKTCRFWALADSHLPSLPAPVCGGSARVIYFDGTCPVDPGGFVPRYEEWRSRTPPEKRALSPVLVNSFGLHCHLLPNISISGAIKPLFIHSHTAYPRPLSLWGEVHAPASNKPQKFAKKQGPEAVTKYNNIMTERIRALHPGSVLEGAVGILSWYGLTDGAKSFDGTHYAFQINMEKAQLLLNVLDVLWGEAVAEGGLWAIGDICPRGRKSYQCDPHDSRAKKYFNDVLEK